MKRLSISLFILSVFLVVTPAVANETAAAPPERPDVAGIRQGLDPASPEALGWTSEQHQAAVGYARSGWVLAFVSPLLSMTILGLLSFTGLAGRFEDFLSRRLPSRTGVDTLFIAAMVVSLAALNFPLNLYRFYRQHQYGFSNQTLAAWFEDSLKGLFFTGIAAIIFFIPVWAAIRRWPRRWWIAGAVLGTVGAILVVMVTPIWVAPRFNTFTPLSEGELRTRILDLAASQGIPAGEVFEVDASRQSRHDNAYVVGLLGTQRIVLYDTLLGAYETDEIEFVMGHEMGHYVLNHMWKGVSLAAIVIISGFFLMHRVLNRLITAFQSRLRFTSAASIAALPLFLLVFSAFMFVIRPVSSNVSKHFERQADEFALNVFKERPGTPDSCVRSFQRMAARNLSTPDPPALIEWWLYSHPSMGKRIRNCAEGAAGS